MLTPKGGEGERQNLGKSADMIVEHYLIRAKDGKANVFLRHVARRTRALSTQVVVH